MEERIRAAVATVQRDVSTAVTSLRELQERKRSILLQVEELAEAEGLATSDAKEELLETLQHTIRVESRYLRMLSRKASATLALIVGQRARLSRMSVAPDDERYKPVVLPLFDRVQECAREINALLLVVQRNVDRELDFVQRSEGRHLFSERFNPAAYEAFLTACAADLGMEGRVAELNRRIASLQTELEVTCKKIDPAIALKATGVVCAGVLLFGYLGWYFTGTLTLFVGVLGSFEYVARTNFLKRWIALERQA